MREFPEGILDDWSLDVQLCAELKGENRDGLKGQK